MDCNEINDFLMDYINRKLSVEKNGLVARHIAKCPDCRKELVEMLQMAKTLKNLQRDIPIEILKTAFDKIEPNNKHDEVTALCQNLYYSLKIYKQTVKLALQVV